MCFTDRLWEDGWKDRYYSSKFGVDGSDQEFRQTVVNLLCLLVLALNICLKYYTLLCFLLQQLSVLNKVTYNMTVDFLQANHYVRGLCWVLRYYYQVKYFSSSDTYMYICITPKLLVLAWPVSMTHQTCTLSWFVFVGLRLLEVVLPLPLCSVRLRLCQHWAAIQLF